MNPRQTVKILPSIEAYKVESEKLIQRYSTDKDKEMDSLREEMRDMKKKFELLEKENAEIKQVIQNNQAKTSEIFSELMARQLEFTRTQNIVLERVNSSEIVNEARHAELIKMLQFLSRADNVAPVTPFVNNVAAVTPSMDNAVSITPAIDNVSSVTPSDETSRKMTLRNKNVSS